MTGAGTYGKLGAKPKLEGRSRQHTQRRAVRGFSSSEPPQLRRRARRTPPCRSSPAAGELFTCGGRAWVWTTGVLLASPGKRLGGKQEDALLGIALPQRFLVGLLHLA